MGSWRAKLEISGLEEGLGFACRISPHLLPVTGPHPGQQTRVTWTLSCRRRFALWRRTQNYESCGSYMNHYTDYSLPSPALTSPGAREKKLLFLMQRTEGTGPCLPPWGCNGIALSFIPFWNLKTWQRERDLDPLPRVCHRLNLQGCSAPLAACNPSHPHFRLRNPQHCRNRKCFLYRRRLLGSDFGVLGRLPHCCLAVISDARRALSLFWVILGCSWKCGCFSRKCLRVDHCRSILPGILGGELSPYDSGLYFWTLFLGCGCEYCSCPSPSLEAALTPWNPFFAGVSHPLFLPGPLPLLTWSSFQAPGCLPPFPDAFIQSALSWVSWLWSLLHGWFSLFLLFLFWSPPTFSLLSTFVYLCF